MFTSAIEDTSMGIVLWVACWFTGCLCLGLCSSQMRVAWGVWCILAFDVDVVVKVTTVAEGVCLKLSVSMVGHLFQWLGQAVAGFMFHLLYPWVWCWLWWWCYRSSPWHVAFIATDVDRATWTCSVISVQDFHLYNTWRFSLIPLVFFNAHSYASIGFFWRSVLLHLMHISSSFFSCSFSGRGVLILLLRLVQSSVFESGIFRIRQVMVQKLTFSLLIDWARAWCVIHTCIHGVISVIKACYFDGTCCVFGCLFLAERNSLWSEEYCWVFDLKSS